MEESQSNVKGGTTPALQTVEVGKCMASFLGNAEEINGSDTGSQQRLVGISPCGVHEKAALVLANGLGKGLGALLKDDFPPTLLGRLADVNLLARGSEELRSDDLALELGLTNLAHDRAAVDGNISEVSQQLLCTVLATYEVEQLRGIVDESCPAVSINKGRVCQKRGQEGNVGLDTSDTELNEGTEDFSASNFVSASMGCALDQHGVVVRSDDSTSKAVATVKTNTVTTSRSVDFNFSGIWSEVLRGIFGGDTALDGKTTSGDSVLGKAELRKSSTSSDLDLGSDNINAGDFLSNGVLDLNTGVDLDEVVAVKLVDQKLCSACIAVVDRLGQSDGVVEDSISDLGGKILGRGNFDDLLVSTLNGAVTLVQVDNVAVVVTEQLDLNVLGLVEESLDENGAIAKGGLGLGSGSLEALLQALGIANNSHTTATTTVGSLDDDGEAILVSEGLDLLVLFNGALSAGDDGDTSSNGKLAGRDLVTKSINDIGSRANKL